MNEEDAFIRAIQAAPNDAAPKLVYADRLEEHDQPLRAEYLRLAVQIVENHTIPQVYHRAMSRYSEVADQILIDWRYSVYSHHWDIPTQLALQELKAALSVCAFLKQPTSNETYRMTVDLIPVYDSAPKIVASHFEFLDDETSLELFQEWNVQVGEILQRWLPAANDPPAGVSVLVQFVLLLVNKVLHPLRCYRVITQRNPFLWSRDSVLFESKDRVLLMTFSAA